MKYAKLLNGYTVEVKHTSYNLTPAHLIQMGYFELIEFSRPVGDVMAKYGFVGNQILKLWEPVEAK